MVSRDTLLELFYNKYGQPGALNWGPRMRLRFGYFTPDDIYEATVGSFVGPDTEWLDVGCGKSMFPFNPAAARHLAGYCRRLAGVDPSDNIHANTLLHERFQGTIEEYREERPFDLITLRMVVEHVAAPESAMAAIARLTKPGGRAIVYTVFRWSPVTVLSAATPLWIHHAAKAIFWHTEEEDTFPVVYRMNTRGQLRRMARKAGLEEESFRYLDDCRSLARWRPTQWMELSMGKMLRWLGIPYPELCILGVYRKPEAR